MAQILRPAGEADIATHPTGMRAVLRLFAEKDSDLRITEEVSSAVLTRAPSEVEATRSTSLPKGSPSVHLDALRGLAAFSVLLAHWRDAFFVDYPMVPRHNPLVSIAYVVTGMGHQWVIVFFVMSGYLVGGSVLRSVKSGRWSWRGYMLTRLTRLYIVLLPALLVGGAIDWAGMHLRGAHALYSGQSGMHALSVNVYSTLTWPILLGNSLFLQTIALPGMGGREFPIFGSNGPLWSLSNEFWYYIAFPLLVLLVAKGWSWWTRAVYSVAILAWGWFVGATIASLGIAWLMGVIITVLPPFPASRSWTRGLAMFFAMAVVLCGLAFGKAHDYLPANLMLGSAVTFLIWVTLYCATAPLPVLYVRVAQRAARSSYTLYLVHLPMLIFLKAFFHLPRTIPNWHNCLIATVVLVGILIYAQIVYEFFEKNTDRVRDWIKPYVMGRRRA